VDPLLDLPEDLRRHVLGLAEDANTHTPLGPGYERIVDPRFVLFLGPGLDPHWSVAQRFRLEPADVEPAVRDIRGLLADRGRSSSTWEVGTHATPADLPERLQALGMVPDDEPFAMGMVLTSPPAGPAASGVTARRVASADEQRGAVRVMQSVFGMAPEQAEPDLARAAADFAHDGASGDGAMFVATVDGATVGAGRATHTPWGVVLNGGSVMPLARGKGAYRALVQARWEVAVERGTPVLVTQAGAMSRRILQRLGFREVTEIRIFLDPPAGRGEA